MKNIFRLSFLVFVLLGILLMGVLTHQKGPYLVLAQLAYFATDSLQFEAVQGRFIDGFSIQDLSYRRHNGDWIEAKTIVVDWRPARLLRGQVYFESIQIEGLRLRLAQPNMNSDIPRPWFLPVQVQQLKIRDAQWQLAEQQFQFDQAQCHLRFDFMNLYCDRFSGQLADGSVAGQFRYSFKDSVLSGKLSTEFSQPRLGAVDANSEFIYSQDRLELKAHTLAPFLGDLKLQMHDLFHQPKWHAEIQCESCLPAPIDGPLASAQLGLNGTISGRGNPLAHPLLINTELTLETGLSQLPTLPLHLSGQLVAGESNQFEFTLGSASFSWPLEQIEDVDIRNFEAQIKGSPEHYIVEGRAEIAFSNTHFGNLNFAGKGDQNSLHFTKFEIVQEQGQVIGSAQIINQNAVEILLQLTLEHVDLAALNPRLQGHFDGEVQVESIHGAPDQSLKLMFKDLSGNIDSWPFTSHLSASLKNDQLLVEDLLIKSGDAQLSASGTRTQNWDVSWRLDIPNLATLSSKAHGAVHANGEISGPADDPELVGYAQATKLLVGSASLEDSQISVHWYGRNHQNSFLHLDTKQIQYLDFEPAQMSLRLHGDQRSHSFELNLNAAEQQALILKGSGHKEPNLAWQGTLDNGFAKWKNWGPWKLQLGSVLDWKNAGLSGHNICWQQDTIELCVSGSAKLDLSSNMLLTFSNFPVNPFINSSLPNLSTPATMQGSLEWIADGKSPQMWLAAQLDPSQVHLALDYDQGSVISYQKGEINVHWQAHQLETQLRLALNPEDYFNLDLSFPATGMPDAESKFAATIGLRLTNLEFIELAFPQIEELAGLLTANLSINGNLARPIIDGAAEMDQFSAFSPDTGTYLKHSRVAMNFKQNRPSIEGKLYAGDGWTEFNWEEDKQLQIIGKNFTLMDLPYASLDLSPNIIGQLKEDTLELTGEVFVDKARLRPPELSLAIRPDSDIHELEKQRTREPIIKVESNLNLTLSDDVYFEGFNLQGYLSGQLAVQDSSESYTTATGTLEINQGSYRAIESSLQITDGRFVFNGGPLFNPDIDIKASRAIESGTAHLYVKGSLLNPDMDIEAGFDDSKADALAYVLLGRKLNEESTEEGEKLYAAAVTMGIRGGQYVARQIQSRLALDSVTVDDDRSTRKTALLLRKYVTPKLLVTYGIGLFNSSRNLNLLYELDKHWALEGNAGRESGADLLFSQEF